jgi:nitric oxide reductase NorE protein
MSTACLTAPPDLAAPTSSPLRGDLAVWVFILAELLAFGVFFLAYAFMRAANVELFNEMQATLDRNLGAINTLLLVSSSTLVARAVMVVRAGHSQRAAHWLVAAMGCGAGFLVVKCFEFNAKFAAGIDLSTNVFYMFYLSLTGFHFLHVVLGMVVLGVLWKQTRAGVYGPRDAHGLESGAAYWHMVDLVWLILFPLVYVMR